MLLLIVGSVYMAVSVFVFLNENCNFWVYPSIVFIGGLILVLVGK